LKIANIPSACFRRKNFVDSWNMSAASPNGKHRFRFPVLSLLVLGAGLLLIFLYFDKPHLTAGGNPLTAAVYLGTGTVLVLWAVRTMVAETFTAISRRMARRAHRYHVRATREAIAYVIILFALFWGALLGRSNMLLLVFALMAGPFVVNGWVTLQMLRAMDVKRVLPGMAFAGHPFSVELRLSNRKRRLSSWMVTVQDRLTFHRGEQAPAVLFARVGPHSEVTGSYLVRPMHRGRYEFGPAQITSQFPLGLMQRSVETGPVEELTVFPRVGRLTAAWRRQMLRGDEIIDQSWARKGAHDDEFHALREYRSGDSRRAIHWRTTARRSELMVREFQECRDESLRIVLDLWQPRRPRDDDLVRVELAISLAASICAEQCHANRHADLTLVICGTDCVRWEGAATDGSLPSLLEPLALADAGDYRDLTSLLNELEQERGPGVRDLLITSRQAARSVPAESESNPLDDPVVQSWLIARAEPAEAGTWIDFET
jgi:uncharacterized protein (DUF58 family)